MYGVKDARSRLVLSKVFEITNEKNRDIQRKQPIFEDIIENNKFFYKKA